MRRKMVCLTSTMAALFLLTGSLYAEDIDTRVYGGTKAKDGELEEVVYISNCTATVVGPNVVLTAAHCRSNNSSVSFKLKGTTHSGTCTRHPQYTTPSYNNDYVLCKVTPAVTGTMASIGKGEMLSVGGTMTLSGYGKPYSGNLYWGNSSISNINSQDFITRSAVYLGSGDSGGPAFYPIKDRTSSEHHWVVGVNSRAGSNTSYLNRTDLERFKTWADSWAASNKVEICGINKVCDKPEKPARCNYEYTELTKQKSEETKLMNDLQKCLKTDDTCVNEIDAFDNLQYRIQEKSMQLRLCMAATK